MKKRSFIIISMCFALFFLSCQKNDLTNETIVDAKDGYQLPNSLKTGMIQENELLKFESKEQFDNVTNLLETETEKWIDKYISALGNISEEELNQKNGRR